MREDLVPGSFCIDNSSDDEPFAGFHNPASTWNGWACPGFPRPEAERIATWTNQMYAEDPDPTRMTWDGDALLMHEPDYADEPGYQPERFEPDTDGLYWIGAWSWTWSEVNETEADETEADETGRPENPLAELDFDTVERAGLDGTGRDGDPRFPYTWSSLTATERLKIDSGNTPLAVRRELDHPADPDQL